MKLKLLIAAVVIIVGLYFLKTQLDKKKEYIPDVPAAGTPGAALPKASDTAAKTADAANKPPVGEVREKFTVGFLPVTCHLTCPVTNWVTEHSDKGTIFEAQKFQDFPSMKEALIARKIDAGFLNMPLGMKLAVDGQPIKIVYLGHRDGTACIVPIDSPMTDFKDLKGKVVAIPGRFSNQNILMRRLMKENGMAPDDITLKELPPPEHPSALAAKAIDAYIIGEPHAAKAEMDGTGRVLFQAADKWPGFISCGLVVRQEVIDQRRPLVEELVSGIARSGKWLDSDKDSGAQHRKDASVVVGKMYYNQKPELLAYVLTKDVNRVKYTGLKPPQDRFDEMMTLGVEMGLYPKFVPFEAYCDTSFAPDLETLAVPFDRLPEVDKVAAK
jgi:NitT/TauT family transport system substrate-binding protein